MSEEKSSRFPAPLLVGAVVVALIVLALYFLNRPGPEGAIPAERHLALGDAEKVYAEQIHISDLSMSRATNLVKQEFTYVNGVMANDGNRDILDIEVVTEFRDQFGQVVLRETQRPFGTATKPGEPLLAGQRSEFQLTFEHVPAAWNQQYPEIRVSGLVLK